MEPWSVSIKETRQALTREVHTLNLKITSLRIKVKIQEELYIITVTNQDIKNMIVDNYKIKIKGVSLLILLYI